MNTETSKSTLLVISTGFLIFHLVLAWPWAVWVSLVAGIIGISSSWLSRKIEWAWMKLAKMLGSIIPNILLSLVFFLFLFPLAVLSRLFNKDPLRLSPDDTTYFVEINKGMDRSRFKKTW